MDEKEAIGTTQAGDKPPSSEDLINGLLNKLFEWTPFIAVAILAVALVAVCFMYNDERLAANELCGKLCKAQGKDQGRLSGDACSCWDPWDQTKPFVPYGTPPAPPMPTP